MSISWIEFIKPVEFIGGRKRPSITDLSLEWDDEDGNPLALEWDDEDGNPLALEWDR